MGLLWVVGEPAHRFDQLHSRTLAVVVDPGIDLRLASASGALPLSLPSLYHTT
jgi:hypothetical protein